MDELKYNNKNWIHGAFVDKKLIDSLKKALEITMSGLDTTVLNFADLLAICSAILEISGEKTVSARSKAESSSIVCFSFFEKFDSFFKENKVFDDHFAKESINSFYSTLLSGSFHREIELMCFMEAIDQASATRPEIDELPGTEPKGHTMQNNFLSDFFLVLEKPESNPILRWSENGKVRKKEETRTFFSESGLIKHFDIIEREELLLNGEMVKIVGHYFDFPLVTKSFARARGNPASNIIPSSLPANVVLVPLLKDNISDSSLSQFKKVAVQDSNSFIIEKTENYVAETYKNRYFASLKNAFSCDPFLVLFPEFALTSDVDLGIDGFLKQPLFSGKPPCLIIAGSKWENGINEAHVFDNHGFFSFTQRKLPGFRIPKETSDCEKGDGPSEAIADDPGGHIIHFVDIPLAGRAALLICSDADNSKLLSILSLISVNVIVAVSFSSSMDICEKVAEYVNDNAGFGIWMNACGAKEGDNGEIGFLLTASEEEFITAQGATFFSNAQRDVERTSLFCSSKSKNECNVFCPGERNDLLSDPILIENGKD